MDGTLSLCVVGSENVASHWTFALFNAIYWTRHLHPHLQCPSVCPHSVSQSPKRNVHSEINQYAIQRTLRRPLCLCPILSRQT